MAPDCPQCAQLRHLTDYYYEMDLYASYLAALDATAAHRRTHGGE